MSNPTSSNFLRQKISKSLETSDIKLSVYAIISALASIGVLELLTRAHIAWLAPILPTAYIVADLYLMVCIAFLVAAFDSTPPKTH